ncbi:C13 family peptidase [Microbulbifer sediminum]|uniref:C13 family peptidase n=1 Tax=Microbulbifer sediminum TaxID=2904250 RepID=UPI001F2114A8|nr:C13 family peptidase [Microbulbifer sediminum]
MKPLAFLSPLSLPTLVLVLTGCGPEQFGGGTALPDGAVYSGNMENGLFHGQGELNWPDGRHYQGTFSLGQMSGQGRMVFADGCIYEGEFREGDFHGSGHYACGDAVWEGEFRQGELVKGSVSSASGDTYEGEFQDFTPHGQGHRTTADGADYEGTFEYGYMVQGNYRDEAGYRYEGEFQYTYYNGEGELTRPDGTIIRANFEYGEANGEGVRIREGDEGQRLEEQGYFVSGRYYPSKQAWQQSSRQQAAAMESRLYSEAERLQAAHAALAPQRPGVRDIYTLVVGGDGTEGVFAREVDWVAGRLATVFDIEGRHLRLTNGGGGELPMATRTSIRSSLEKLDSILDPQEDLLLVHFVSHGDENGDLVLAEHNLSLNDLSVADGSKWLDGLEAEYQWVIVSACYSGQWQEALAGPNRVVFTSAAADRTSFGCSDDSERTWFSAALYGDALAVGPHDPAAWFAAANRRVTEMEKEQGITGDEHSMPQHSIGERFLQWWQAQAR